METLKGSGAGQRFGVAGFVIGLITLVLSFIPCLGMYALLPGIIAILFSVIALVQANKANASSGLIIAALIISILGSSIASWQIVNIRRAATGIDQFGTELQEIFRDDLGDEIRDKIKNALENIPDPDTIPYEDTIEFDSEEMIEELERLEGEKHD